MAKRIHYGIILIIQCVYSCKVLNGVRINEQRRTYILLLFCGLQAVSLCENKGTPTKQKQERVFI